MAAQVLERELPVAWDGVEIRWSVPQAVGGMFVCPPPKVPPACTSCGQLQADGANSYVGSVPDGADTWRHRLVLVRCLGCGHDQVTDLDGGELWDLDESDYGPDGSLPPEPEQRELELAFEPDPPAAVEPAPALRDLPAEQGSRSKCDGCGRAIVWAITVASPTGRGGKLMPLEPTEDLAGNVAVTQPAARGLLHARALFKDERVDRPGEYVGMPHFARCARRGHHPTPPWSLAELMTSGRDRRRGRR